jgi:7,8-dihydropterin-6-yl-methyl-4-(beta-D-ribofuranosyl)aminobenzene 5'-phosphate synthase
MADSEAVTGLEPVDRLRVQVVIDNVTDNLSTVPDCVQHEMEFLRRRGMPTLAGECLCCGAWGLSLALTTQRDGETRSLLFDAGPDGAVYERNSLRLQIDHAAIDAVVLSHGHFDHAAGLMTALQFITAAKRGKPTPLYLHPGMFRRRALRLPSGPLLTLKDVPQPPALEQNGAKIVETDVATLMLDGHYWLSGEIPRVTGYEKGLPNQVRQTDDGGWEPDPWIVDERFLAAHVKDKGLVVFSACSHAGIVNVMTEARARFPDLPMHAVMGGLHLAGAAVEKIIPETVADLAGFKLDRIIPGHCTGWRAVNALAAAFGEAVVDPCAVGRLYSF